MDLCSKPSRAEDFEKPFLQPAQSSVPPLSSYSRRFVLRGFDARDAGTLSTWLESMTTRLESRLGEAVPFGRTEIVQVVGVDAGEYGPGRIRFSQEFFGTALQQRMTVENPEAVTQEMLLEALVRVHINRYIVAMRRRIGPADSMLLPDWFSVGIAQSLIRDLLERNETFVREAWTAGEVKSVATMLMLRTLPEQWVPDKAWCGVFMNWLLRNITDTIGWQGVITYIASGEDMDMAWITEEVLKEDESKSVEKRWELRLARLSKVQVELGAVDSDSILALKKILEIYPRDMISNPSDVVPLRLGPDDLVSYAHESWVFPVCNRKLTELALLSAGKAPEFVTVVNGYANFFRILGGSAGGGNVSGGKLRKIRRALENAEAEAARLERSLSARDEYISNVESDRTQTPPSPNLTAEEDAKERERQKFLDNLERQRSSP
jgi:hypothetical protein